MKEEDTTALILRAARFSAEKHSRQRRKDAEQTPYINHPLEVAETLSSIGGVSERELIIAALLHDTLEDTETSPEGFEALFGTEVLSLVKEVTNDESLDKDERKRQRIVTASAMSDGAKQLKLSDMICNLRSQLRTPPRDWDDDRKLAYFDWAGQVFARLQGVNAALDATFQKVHANGIQRFDGDLAGT